VLDDLPSMDDAELRRGQPAAHIQFGEAVAILAAFGLLNEAFGHLARSYDAGLAQRLSATLSNAVGPVRADIGYRLNRYGESEPDPGARFAFRDSVVVRERIAPGGARHDLESRTIAREWDDALMRTDDFIPPSAWALEASLLRELSGFDPLFRFSDDWDFILRARRRTVPVRVPGVTVEVRMREGGNASADFGPERLADLRELEKRHGLRPLVPKTFWEVAETVSRS